ncbi:AcrR family transcriptional regulator [Nakamurella sp. UYEF19]|uniref:TetR/AcrR family transcriptional regulator n=1 Tax=Nakamurella sp. UYEF19 TaxID=1756392 RepID=UPI003397C957
MPTVSTVPGLREQKKLSTRAALTEQALRLADERGYDGFTIADLVDSVGVSRRTFSNYFAGKAECLAAISDSWMDGALGLIESAPADRSLTALLREVLENLSEQIVNSRTGILAMADSEPELAAALGACELVHGERVAAVISARTSLAADDIRISLLAEFALSAGRACIQRWVMRDRAGGREGLARDLDLAFSLIDFDRLT